MSQINVNTITGKDGGSAVNFPHGIIVTGVVTATSLNQTVNGNITATSFTGPLTGAVTGNVTGNCSGTAGSLAAGATGADLTLSGDLTVNGTTTTIDTAVTAVDSLAVEGSVGIGTTNPQLKFVVSNNGALGFEVDPSQSSGTVCGVNAYDRNASAFKPLRLNAEEHRFDTSSTERLRIDQHGTTKFKGPLTEKFHNDSNALTGDYNHDLITHGNVYWSVSNSSGPFTFNLRGSASVSLNDMMSDGESLSFLLTHSTNNASNYMTAFKVDGNTLINGTHIWWSGGTAPSAAGTSGYDVYSFTLYKIAGASFRAFASLTNHA